MAADSTSRQNKEGIGDIISKKTFSNINIINYVVIISIAAVVGFTAISLYFYYRYGTPIPDIKTEIFSFFGAELVTMGVITGTKNLKEKKQGGMYDE